MIRSIITASLVALGLSAPVSAETPCQLVQMQPGPHVVRLEGATSAEGQVCFAVQGIPGHRAQVSLLSGDGVRFSVPAEGNVRRTTIFFTDTPTTFVLVNGGGAGVPFVVQFTIV